jgi:hypothetical protein
MGLGLCGVATGSSCPVVGFWRETTVRIFNLWFFLEKEKNPSGPLIHTLESLRNKINSRRDVWISEPTPRCRGIYGIIFLCIYNKIWVSSDIGFYFWFCKINQYSTFCTSDVFVLFLTFAKQLKNNYEWLNVWLFPMVAGEVLDEKVNG